MHSSLAKARSRLSLGLSALCITSAFLGTSSWGATQQYQYATSCSDCHKMAPIDAAYRNVTTGGFKGSHSTHNPPSVAPQASCERCHSGSTSYTTAHMNDFVNMTSNINRSPHPSRATYNKPRFFNQTSNPVMQTCSNVNCHFEATTPVWSSAPYSSPADCNGCHGAPPSDGSHPATNGSGKKHGDYYTTTTTSCSRCHPDHTADAAPFAHATSSGRQLLIIFETPPNSGYGRYTGNVNYPNYLPSHTPPRNGTCKNLYCHSPGNRISSFDDPNATATWGGSLTCAGCHKSNSSSGDPMVSASHGKHVDGGYSNYNCVKCHRATTSASLTITTMENHVNGNVNVAFDSSTTAVNGTYNGSASPMSKPAGSATGACANVYCHSTVQPDGGVGSPAYQVTPAWGSGTYMCGKCHADGSSHMGDGTMASGSHTAHLLYPFQAGSDSAKCAMCHNIGGQSYSPGASCSSMNCHANGGVATKHADHNVDVSIVSYFGGAYGGTPSPGDTYGSCLNVYCHSDGKATPTTYATPIWGNAASGACGSCHGANASAPPATAPHSKHVGASYQYRYACAECHSRTVKHTVDSTTFAPITSTTFHVNKAREVAFDATNPFGSYSSSVLGCRSVYCHSIGKISVAAGNLPGTYNGSVYARPNWSGTTACNSCHGRSTFNGMPDYTNAGVPGSSTSNSHYKHVTSSNISCAECHEKTTKNNTTIRPTSPSYHVAGAPSVFFNLTGNNVSGTYDSNQKKCSNTYCHGVAASVAWGGTTYCNSCHSANDGTSGGGGVNNWGTGVSAHTLHVEDTTILPAKYTNYSVGNLSVSSTIYRFGCASCHNPAQAAHANGYASGSYRAQVFFGYTSPGKKPTYTYTGTAGTADNGFAWSNGNTVCSQTYCHSNGAGTNGSSVSWSTTANTAGVGRCQKCHGNATYTADYRGGAPLYASGSISYRGSSKGNAHQLHIDAGSGAAAATDPQCLHCHAGTTTTNTSITNKVNHIDKGYEVTAGNTFADGNAVGGAAVAVTTSYTYNASGSACSNVSCHPTGLTGAKSTDVVAWNDKHTCDDCHKVNLNNNTGYHHAMRNYSGSGAAYPKAIPGITAGANDVNRRCTMCHVDHATFSPNLNVSNTTYGSAGNIRMSILSTVTATKGYTNRDFIKTGSGGICISCHNVELFKDTGNVRVKNEANSTKTVAIVLNNYTGSAHEYAISSAMKRDSKIFYSDCSKCHNGRRSEVAVFSGMTTATHDRDVRRIYANLGTSLTDGIDALFCYRCHSHSTDSIGGTAKPVDGKDYYNTASMSSAAEGIFTACSNIGVSSYPTTSSSLLYLQNNGTTNAVPPAPEPAGYQFSSGTYTTNVFTQRDMSPTSGSTTASTNISTGSTVGRFNRGIQFVSPQIDNTVTIPSGSTLTLTIREVRATGTSTDYTRFTVYKWNGTTATPLNTNAAPNNYAENATAIATTATNRSTTFTTNSTVTLNPGDALICDVEFDHSAGTTALNVTYSYGNFATDGAQLQLPAGTYNWRTGAISTRAGHNVGNVGTAVLHKPSATDETQAYLASNRHVSCNDCHNVHVATAANPLNGTWGIDPTNSTAGAAPTSYAVVSVANADLQYKVCFKCHTDWAGYGTGTTNLAVDFNTANDSFHWVEKDKYTYTVNSGTGRGIWQNAQFNLNAVPTQGTKTYVEVMMPRTGITYDNATLRTLPLRCSDCHGSDSADGGVNVPEGPHGSAYANILKVPAGSPYTTWNSSANYSSNSGTIWCFNCHINNFTGTGLSTTGSNLHLNKHNSSACQYCHLAIPHGSGSEGAGSANQRKHLLKPSVFTDGVDSETSGSYHQHQFGGVSYVIPGCT